MRLTPILAAAVLASSAVLSAIGCSARPQTVQRVDQSVLPADAKGILSPDAQINSVYKETYAKNTVMYRINYTLDGKQESVLVSDKHETTPTGVFEKPLN